MLLQVSCEKLAFVPALSSQSSSDVLQLHNRTISWILLYSGSNRQLKSPPSQPRSLYLLHPQQPPALILVLRLPRLQHLLHIPFFLSVLAICNGRRRCQLFKRPRQGLSTLTHDACYEQLRGLLGVPTSLTSTNQSRSAIRLHPISHL